MTTLRRPNITPSGRPPLRAISLTAIRILSLAMISYGVSYADEPRITGPLADGTPSPPPPPKTLPAFRVEKSHQQLLPNRRVIMHRVANPGLPEPPPPPAPPSSEEIEAIRNSPEFQDFIRNHQPHVTIFLSATVVDRKATYLHWWHNRQEFVAWSNVDFNHLSGFAEFESDGTHYTLIMGLGDVTSDRSHPSRWPGQPPTLGVTHPAYTLVEGDETAEEALAMMDALHDLYAVEKDRLIAAYKARERARAKREAYLKANPPVPQDTIIHFWPRKNSRYQDENSQQREESR